MRNCKGIKVLTIIEHRLTQPVTPKTNGMVERVNGTIKNATVKAITYQNIDEMKQDLNKFLYSLLSKTTLRNISGFLIDKSGFKLYQYSKVS
jgi:transposase InsO family protein